MLGASLPRLCLLLLAGSSPALADGPSLMVGGGLRTTVSAFDHGSWRRPATGTGGHLRVQLGERVGSEWYYDYITNDLGSGARRVDDHIGWSLLFYPIPTDGFRRPILPYLISGHCFDYTRVTAPAETGEHGADRWSSAVQAGLGVHLNLTPDLDLSVASQYMVHLGNAVHFEHGHVHTRKGAALEGHLLNTVSVNYKLTR